MEHEIKATVINPDECKELFKTWGQFTSVCYDTHTDAPETVGKGCMYSDHWSGSRWRYIALRIDNCPRFVIDQSVRHEQGVVKNVQSFRYVDKDNFAYAIPEEIKDNDVLMEQYWYHMRDTVKLYQKIQSYVYNKTNKHERANEQARYVLPMATEGSYCIAFTPEALIHLCNLRLCVRTEDKHRQLAKAIRDAVLEVVPELQSRLVPQCEWLMYCPEGKKSCGRYPTRAELKQTLEQIKADGKV